MDASIIVALIVLGVSQGVTLLVASRSNKNSLRIADRNNSATLTATAQQIEASRALAEAESLRLAHQEQHNWERGRRTEIYSEALAFLADYHSAIQEQADTERFKLQQFSIGSRLSIFGKENISIDWRHCVQGLQGLKEPIDELHQLTESLHGASPTDPEHLPSYIRVNQNLGSAAKYYSQRYGELARAMRADLDRPAVETPGIQDQTDDADTDSA